MKRNLISTALITTILAFSAPSIAPASADVVSMASRYVGTNPTRMRRAWCANFMNMMERKAGRPGTGSNLAASFLRSKHYKRIPRSQLRRGDIVYNGRRGGGHVSYYIGEVPGKKGRGVCAKTISGNTSRRVNYAVRNMKNLVALRPVGGGSRTAMFEPKIKKRGRG
jgi:uncharacterized protein (TIGR02594 family)